MSEAVTGTVNNYYSTKDSVLKYMYTAAQANSVAVGLKGFECKYTNIKDHDVTAKVAGTRSTSTMFGWRDRNTDQMRAGRHWSRTSPGLRRPP
ncbi:DUF726 domain-containing protein [Rhodococcus kronopolitis]|uniref:DUF726 domain-containing protein n=1 Tax=Rhodococcus kronopolitis TaxID=1460226 RepID=A0ABV9FX72_9NOCA